MKLSVRDEDLSSYAAPTRTVVCESTGLDLISTPPAHCPSVLLYAAFFESTWLISLELSTGVYQALSEKVNFRWSTCASLLLEVQLTSDHFLKKTACVTKKLLHI
jgi:hypothetical protein